MRTNKAIEVLALAIAEVSGQLGFHKERWYDEDQRKKYHKQARELTKLLHDGGYEIVAEDGPIKPRKRGDGGNRMQVRRP